MEAKLPTEEEIAKSMSFAGRATAKIIGTIIDHLLTKLFLPYSREQIGKLIENKVNVIDILRECQAEWQDGRAKNWKPHSKMAFVVITKLLGLARMCIKRLPKDITEEYLKPKRFVEWAKARRPDLADAFSTEAGAEWLVDVAQDIQDLLTKEVG